MAQSPPVPETRVLAVASHVVSGYVGNKIAVFTMQSLGCDVAALNTVQFSNHTGYKQWTGSQVTAQEIEELWKGLKQSYLDRFDMLLSGYIPGAPAVEVVGRIAKELREKARRHQKPGSFFWVLDPVMGDKGRIYVAQDVVPAYQKLVAHADLILPNQFEAELLSDISITDMASLLRAIETMHERDGIPHIVITSVSLAHADHAAGSLCVVGSTMTSERKPRVFKIVFPAIDCYFSGTGDMFAALMVVRMREAVWNTPGLPETASWVSGDDVDALDLPLAQAAEKVLASMHEVLAKTAEAMQVEMAEARRHVEADGETALALRQSRAAELRLVRHLDSMRSPVVEFRAAHM